MHPVAHSFTKLDPNPKPGEEHIRRLFRSCPDCDPDGCEQLRAAGVDWGTILSLLVKYGPAFKEVLQVILAALKAEPPEPLTVEQKKAKAPPARQDEPEEPPPHSGQREDKATKDTTPSSPPTLTAKDLQPKKPEVKGEPPSKAK
jgi:hypothetical protein